MAKEGGEFTAKSSYIQETGTRLEIREQVYVAVFSGFAPGD